jgi:hypothetical protein
MGMHLARKSLRARSAIVGMTCLLSLLTLCAAAQENPATQLFDKSVALNTEAVAPQRFIAAHGRLALIDGYASDSLEIWAYPFQILSGYRIAFRASGATTPVNGQDILSRVTYEPGSITRVYIGPDFIVHERLFVPLNLPGAILSYSIQSAHAVEIEVHATPVLNLMWPAAMGGQSVAWNSSLSAFVLSEPVNGYSATMGSSQIVDHDEIGNRTAHGVSDAGLGFTLRPDGKGHASVFVALNPHHGDPGILFHTLMHDRQVLEAEANAHQAELRDQMLRIETPDLRVNQAIAWAEIALDQAWVCNHDLGCGFVAGYGPSRGARRPQYNWFFAGDGLIAADAAMMAGDRDHARAELEFILHYQDAKTGMIWHELSQSAGFLDWVGKYPYMFVHVDITFQFMGTLARYVSTTGDIDFARKHWQAIEAAYHYCQSIIDRSTGLPRIPADKEGGNEQDRMSDDLGLSTSWVEAASAFAQLANLSGHADMAKEAQIASTRASAAIPAHYWNAQQSFWISGHMQSGQAMAERRSSPSEGLSMHLFSADQTSLVLDQIASSSFQTDWGTRGIGAGSAGFDPESYAKGSISALHTAGVAQAFWAEHRPVTALALWRSILPWTSLDSLGHMHEVLAGNFYRAQVESVPEQTWSSAGFLNATVHGLLGLQVDAVERRVAFAPRIPSDWNDVSIDHLRVAGAPNISLALHRTATELTLKLDNPGDAFRCEFAPELPLGAKVGRAYLSAREVSIALEQHAQETDAHVVFDAPHGMSELHLKFQDGVSVIASQPAPLVGEASHGIHVIGVHLKGHVLTLDADVPSDRESRLQLQTGWQVASARGITANQAVDGRIDLTFAASHDVAEPYRRARAVVEFKP